MIYSKITILLSGYNYIAYFTFGFCNFVLDIYCLTWQYPIYDWISTLSLLLIN